MKRCSVALRLVAVALALAHYSSVTNADHLPEDLLAGGQPETVLAGIDLTSTTYKKIVRLYGKPTKQQKVPNNPGWTGYIWELPGAKLEVDAQGEEITGVYVEGTATGRIGSTGRGLKLRGDIESIRRIYGSKFEDFPRRSYAATRMDFMGVSSALRRITIQWKSQDFTLTIGLDDQGKISALWLLLPECYPDGCE